MLQALGRPDAALATFERLLAVKPDDPDALNDVGVFLYAAGRLDEAEARLRRALTLRPGYASALNNLATVLLARGQRDDAAQVAERAVALDPTEPSHLDTLGAVWRPLGRLEDAIVCHEQALMLHPGVLTWLLNLGSALVAAGRQDEATTVYRQALECVSDIGGAHSGLISALDLIAGAEAEARGGAAPLQTPSFRKAEGDDSIRPLTGNVPDPDRRIIGIGYVSADLRRHSAASLILPILRAHDHAQFEVVCYSGVTLPDAVTAEARGRSPISWRDVARACPTMCWPLGSRADEIDILVDLSGHSAGNRPAGLRAEAGPTPGHGMGLRGPARGLEAIDAFSGRSDQRVSVDALGPRRRGARPAGRRLLRAAPRLAGRLGRCPLWSVRLDHVRVVPPSPAPHP